MNIKEQVISLLKTLISIPSISREEDKTADAITQFLKDRGIKPQQLHNNIWVQNQYFEPEKPTLLLNSHHDTVKPNSGYSHDPFEPIVKGNKLFGLGCNDAGGALVALLASFIHFYSRKDLDCNIIFAATAEEEISGPNGIESILNELGPVSLAVVGEPTLMNMAIAEKGLLVVDCIAEGISGHAARNEGENAIYKAMNDIKWFKNYKFQKVSRTLGEINMNVTQIEAGTQHNVIPDRCKFTVDIRVTDAYSHEEVLEIIKDNTKSIVTPRSVRLRSSGIDPDHAIVKAAIELGRETYGSPTLSDQALMPFPSVKIGPGDSRRSHTADEFIYIDEIEEGIDIYIKLLEKIL